VDGGLLHGDFLVNEVRQYYSKGSFKRKLFFVIDSSFGWFLLQAVELGPLQRKGEPFLTPPIGT
jgi:hypothetical protein